jgi:hypothetical protein
VSNFTYRSIIILMETIKNLYKRHEAVAGDSMGASAS